MADLAKKVLTPYVAAWLDVLDSCVEKREEWNILTQRMVKRDVLLHPTQPEHTGWLHHLIEADYQPLMSKAEADVFREKIKDSKKGVPVERKEFPAGYYWTIIKKWDRRRKLRVIARIKRYVNLLCEFWERYWHIHGGKVSPYTLEWIHHANLVETHCFVYGVEPGERQHAEWAKQFPAVAVMQRIEKGESARAEDIKTLQPWASSWCNEHVAPVQAKLGEQLHALGLRADFVSEDMPALQQGVAVLYAAVLAQDIQARHRQGMVVVNAWQREYGLRVSGLIRTLGNKEYIYRLRKIMPLYRVGDPALEQARRMAASKKASNKRKTPPLSRKK